MNYSYKDCEKYIKYNNYNYELLLNYINFDLNDNDFFDKLLKNCKNENILKHVITNVINLECKDIYGKRPIHYICEYSTPEMIKYIIGKGVNLECRDGYGRKPIHYICGYSTPEMIKYIIDKEVDLECEGFLKMRPIHYLCQNSTPKMIKYIIDKGIKLDFNNYLQLENSIDNNDKLSIDEKDKMIEYINKSKNIKNVMVKKAIKKN
jgi:ankyrin repeat protein